jgi:hypothetical protein
MASHQLIDTYLTELAGGLPADAVDELADGLLETWHHHRDRGLGPTAAARTAIAEFGTARQITDAFVAQATGRRTARMLLSTGPIVGVCWGASLMAARVWTWPVPAAAAASFAITLLAAVACLVAAATSRHSYRRTRLGDIGAAGLVALDVAMLVAVPLAAPALVWPMALAVPASLCRVGITLRRLPGVFAR